MRSLKPNSFLKNVVTLTTGTTIAQAIPALISPILTRIYSPEDFGLLAIFISITSLFTVLVTGKYELAIVLPEEEINAQKLVRLSLVLTLYSCIALLVIFFLAHQPMLHLFKDKRISIWLYLVPVAVFFTASLEVYRFYCIRHKAYKDISKSSVIKSGTASIFQIGLGLLNSGPLGLLLGNMLSIFTGNLPMRNIFTKNKIKNEEKDYEINSLKKMATRYNNFPKFTLPSLFLNNASLQLPIFFFSTFFSSATVGFYALTQRVLNMPMTIIGSSIGQVFFQKASEHKGDPIFLRSITWKLYKDLLKIGIFPLSILLFFGKEIFSFVFSSQWETAGVYAQILSVWIFFVFISSPLSNLFFVQERQKEGLILHIVIFSSRIIVLFACVLFHFDALETVFYFGAIGAIVFLGFIFYLLSSIGIKKMVIVNYTLIVIIVGFVPVYLFKAFLWKLL